MRILSIILFELFLLVCSEARVSEGKVYYITPESGYQNDFCKVSSETKCLTLSEFASITSSQAESNTSLIILPGKHLLDREIKLSKLYKVEIYSEKSYPTRPTIVCHNLSRFDLNTVHHLLISHLDFRGCQFTLTDSPGQTKLVNSTFTGSEGSGTVLLVSNSNITIEKSSFISNKGSTRHSLNLILLLHMLQQRSDDNAPQLNTVFVGGVVVATRQSYVNVSECNFIANSAPLGGAIFAEQSSQIFVSHSTFIGTESYIVTTNNSTDRNATESALLEDTNKGTSIVGGAVFLHNSSLMAYQCSFLENAAQIGGVIFAYQSNISLSNCQLNGNTAGYKECCVNPHVMVTNASNNNTSPIFGGYGGGLYVLNSDLSLDTCAVIDNTALLNGGVIHAENGSVRLHGSTFSHNSANQLGGAIFANNSHLELVNSVFRSNIANNTGGALYVLGRNMSSNTTNMTVNVVNDLVSIIVYGCNFSNNSALRGGAVYSYGVSLAMRSNTFASNFAKDNGGAVMIGRGTVEVAQCILSYNTAEYNGGAFYCFDNSSVIIENSTFAFNNVIHNAGGINGVQSQVLILNSVFRGNNAKWGGAIASHNNATITIEECSFEYNTAKWGGALASYKAVLIVNRSILAKHEVMRQGGVAHAHESLLIIEASSFSNNRALEDGGVLGGIDAILIVRDSTFSNNQARYYGSVMHWKKGTISTFGQVFFEMNEAEKGIMYLYHTTANFTGETTFVHNQGSLYTFSSHVTFAGKTLFDNCSSDPLSAHPLRTKRTVTSEISKLEGGALTITFESTVIFNGHCSFLNNRAKVGGAFIITESKVYIHGESIIANNVAANTGGGVYLYQGELTCSDGCTLQINNNHARNRGGGMHCFSSLLKVKNSNSTIVFRENNADLGGGICLEMDTKIYILKTEAISTNTISFTENSATLLGGAIYVIDRPHSCTSMTTLPYITNECFLQTIEQYDVLPSYLMDDSSDSLINYSNTTGEKAVVYFFNNTAPSGTNLYH